MQTPKMARQGLLFARLAFFHLCFFIIYKSDPSISEDLEMPLFAFGWSDDKDTFQAGELATIKIKVLWPFESKPLSTKDVDFSPIFEVQGKIGNSSYISELCFDFGNNFDSWKISFVPTAAGLFFITITDEHLDVMDASLHYTVLPGQIYPSVCGASWMGFVNEFVAGDKVAVLIHLRDAFGNDVPVTGEGPIPSSTFVVSAYFANGSISSIQNTTFLERDKYGYLPIEFVVYHAGRFLLHIDGGNQTLRDSPLPFKVKSGPLDLSSCWAKWKFETNLVQLYSLVEVFIYQQDQYGNLVPGLHEFDAQVVEAASGLSIPIADLQFVEVAAGIQLFSFSALEPGEFLLIIYDMKQNKTISHMPYNFTIFVGYCDRSRCIVNGSDINATTAGNTETFSVFLLDSYQYPSPVEVQYLQVQILRRMDPQFVPASIKPKEIANASKSLIELNPGGSYEEIVFGTPVALVNSLAEPDKVLVSSFDVSYTPLKSGIYDIRVFCGNVPLDDRFTKAVRPGNVDMSLSGITNFVSEVPKLNNNAVQVCLVDSYNNPVSSQESKLKLEVASNISSFSNWTCLDGTGGSYICHYVAKDLGAYEICISFDGKVFSTCPLRINVYNSDYFPKANDDWVSVWQDQSIQFNVLENDYFPGGNGSIFEFSKPNHGSLLQNGQHFRYTPYRTYFGNDFFSYSISDSNGNLASGRVNLSVLLGPPRFTSLPGQLLVTEDVLFPKFGGLPGFGMEYADVLENISVIFTAQFGNVFLAPILLRFWQPMWDKFSAKKVEVGSRELVLEGSVQVINDVLQSIQYIGNENFYGNDTIRVSAINRNGANDANVSVFVEPINDPPYIRVPEFIILKRRMDEGSLIFDKESDEFDFFIGDPDLPNFPGGESNFLVTFSMEVSNGLLTTNLPVNLINTTELKLKNSYQWKPLQTFVTISKHFTVKAKGIRVRGAISDCNNVMQKLLYNGTERGTVLTLRLNDMGNYGRYPGFPENVTSPLFAEATVALLRSPGSSRVSHTLGSVILVEFIIVLSLGVLLLLFACKCIILLVRGRKRGDGYTRRGSFKSVSNQLPT